MGINEETPDTRCRRLRHEGAKAVTAGSEKNDTVQWAERISCRTMTNNIIISRCVINSLSSSFLVRCVHFLDTAVLIDVVLTHQDRIGIVVVWTTNRRCIRQ